MMMSIKGGYSIFIILLIGLNHLRADEDITEAISDTTDAIITQVKDKKWEKVAIHIHTYAGIT